EKRNLIFSKSDMPKKKGSSLFFMADGVSGKQKHSGSSAKISPMSFFPVRRLQTRYSSQNFQSRYYGKIFRPDNIFQNLQIGKKPFVRYLTCLMATEKN